MFGQDPEADFETIAETLGDVVVRLNADGLVTYVSPSIEAYGRRPEDLLGTSGLHLVHPEDRQRFLENTRSALKGERPSPAGRIHRFLTASGEVVHLEGNPRVALDAIGRPDGMVNVLRDVSARVRAERRAADLANLYRTGFEHAGVGKALVAPDGRFLEVNAAFCDILGRTRAEMSALDLGAVIPEADLVRGEGPESEGGPTGGARVLEVRCARPDGDAVHLRLTTTAVRAADGSTRLQIVQITDETQRVRAESALARSEFRYRFLTEHSADIIACFDREARFTYLSPSVEAVLGWTPEELVGRSTRTVMHPHDYARSLEVFSRHMAGPDPFAPFAFEYRGRRKDGREVWLEAHPRPIVHADTREIVGWQDVVRDVTERKRLEAELREARREAEQAARAKSDFLANMSHELRTPLTSIIGYAELLGREALAPSAARAADRVLTASRFLLALVNDVLDAARLEAGETRLEARPARLADLTAAVAQLLAVQAQHRALDLQVEIDPELPAVTRVDPDKVRQVLINLLGNALKFTERGSVRLAATRAREGWARFEVSDTGPGIEAEAQARLFQRFSRGDGVAARRHGGSGLGLAICRALVEAMGGRIGVESAPGRGSRFWFEIPAPAADGDFEGVFGSGAAEVEGLRMLVVDDDAPSLELAADIGRAAGMATRAAAGGAEAVEIAAREPFDVILLDRRMPDLDGEACARSIQAEGGLNADTPILLFTADLSPAPEGLFTGVVRKPLLARDLLSAVARAAAGPTAGAPPAA